MSSTRSITGARQRRAGEQPQTSGSRANTSINSQQAFAQQQMNQRQAQGQNQRRPVTNPQESSLGQNMLAEKMSIPKAFTLVTIRLGRLEQYVQQLQEESANSDNHENTENMRLIDNNIIQSITTRIENLEKKLTTSNDSKSQILKLETDIRETKDLLMMLMMKYEKFTLDTNEKMANLRNELCELIEQQISDKLSNETTNNINNSNDIEFADHNSENEIDNVNLKDIIESELVN
jgi:hypothetical protein